MAKGKKTGGRDFKPGNKAAVGHGRPRLTPEMKKVAKLTQSELEFIINSFLTMTREEIQKFAKDPKAPILHVIIASILARAATTSDHNKLEAMLIRLIGKMPDKSGEEDQNKPFTLAYPNPRGGNKVG